MAEGKGQIVLRLAESQSKDHPLAMATQEFADLVNSRTKGRIKIRIYYDGELGDKDEVLEQLQFGGIAAARLPIENLSIQMPSLVNFIKDKIFLPPYELMDWFMANRTFLAEECAKEGFIPIAAFYPDFRCFYALNDSLSSRKNLFTDLTVGAACGTLQKKGLERLGIENVLPIARNTYSSLSNGYVDAIETSFMDFCYSNDYNFIEEVLVSDYAAYPSFIVMSSTLTDSITPSDMSIIYSSATEAMSSVRNTLNEHQKMWMERIRREKTLLALEDLAE